MKKKILIIAAAIFSFFLVCIVGLIVFYNCSLRAVSKDSDKMTFVVNQGVSSKEIIDLLYEDKLIRNKYVGYVYLKFHGDIVLQAGVYELDTSMSLIEIIEHISKGNVIDDSVSITFVEGKRLTTYVKQISQIYGISEEEILAKMEEREYLESLIDKYWFLTDEILNDKLYYALEGYLSPNTYFFDKNADITDIIEKMLDTTSLELKRYEDDIASSEYTIHEMITMASIVELEGANSNDRRGVAGVFYNRLKGGWSLGSDVTTYYGIQVEMSERDLWQYEIEAVNDYNTRVSAMAGKLPVGPICNPSVDSIIAAFEPESHDYYFFVADKNGKTYFTKTNAEHEAIVADLKAQGLWYSYE